MRWATLCVTAAACALVLCAARDAEAQGVVLEQWLGPDDDGPVIFAPRSAELAAADALLERGAWRDAADALAGIVARRGADAPLAEQRLAAALMQLGHLTASHRLFARIAARPGHPGRPAAYLALARLAARLPDAADVGEALARYGIEHLARLGDRPRLRARVAFLTGRAHYRDGRDEDALAFLAEVGAASRWFPRAQLLGGMVAVRDRRAPDAARAFKAAIDALEGGRDDALRDLARLSLARLFYSSAFAGQAVAIDARRLNAAVRQWQAIGDDSPHWFSAQLELAWAYFMAGDHPRALGLLHTVQAPYFEDRFVAEADVLRAITYFTNCDYDNTLAVVARSRRDIDAVSAALTTVLRRGDELPARLAHGLPGGDERARGLFDAVRRQERIAGLLRYAAHTRRARAALRDMPMTPALEVAAAELAQASRAARRGAAALARRELRGELEALARVRRDGQKLTIDVVNAQRALLEEMAGGTLWTDRGDPVFEARPDPEHVMWPFDGEYWRDELGTYRVVVTSRCR
jgi:hypothetical protein